MHHLPRRHEDRRAFRAVDALQEGETAIVRGQIEGVRQVRVAGRKSYVQASVGDGTGYVEVRWWNMPWLAKSLGAEQAITGLVQKVSNLILNINIYVRDARTGDMVAAASADIRGNTDQSWSRGVGWLVRNRLLKD